MILLLVPLPLPTWTVRLLNVVSRLPQQRQIVDATVTIGMECKFSASLVNRRFDTCLNLWQIQFKRPTLIRIWSLLACSHPPIPSLWVLNGSCMKLSLCKSQRRRLRGLLDIYMWYINMTVGKSKRYEWERWGDRRLYLSASSVGPSFRKRQCLR